LTTEGAGMKIITAFRSIWTMRLLIVMGMLLVVVGYGGAFLHTKDIWWLAFGTLVVAISGMCLYMTKISEV